MPEALARSDHDFVAPRPRRAAKKAPPQAPERSRAYAAWRLARAYPGAAFGLVCAIVLTGGIFVNALVLQKQRHPAPLFSAKPPVAQPAEQVAATPQAPAPVAAAVPQPAPRPASLSPGLLDKPTPLQRVPARETGESAPRGDAIANLLRSGPSGQSGAEANASVLGAQRALAKLGFAVKPDGVMGGATRQAIERFERDHGLPARGDLTPKIMRMLAAQSGVAVD